MVGVTYIANLRAIEPSRLLCLPAEEFRRLLAESATFAERMLDSMRERVMGVQEATRADSPVTVAVAGRPLNPACHDVRDFLARNHVAFDYYDLDDSDAETVFTDSALHREHCPLVQIYDGPLLENPTPRALAEGLNIATVPKRLDYDVAIFGGGPAGLPARPRPIDATRSRANRISCKRACRASSPPATCGPTRSSAVPQPSVKAAWRSRSSTNISRRVHPRPRRARLVP